MKRYELIEKLWNELLEDHKEKFGWADGKRDSTGYLLVHSPTPFDHEGWVEKVESLEKALDFLNHMGAVMEKLEAIGASEAIRVEFYPKTRCYASNCKLIIYQHQLIYAWGNNYAALAARLVPVTTTEPLTEEELREKQEEALAALKGSEALALMKKVVEEELEKAREHLAWLEEEIEEPEDDEESEELGE